MRRKRAPGIATVALAFALGACGDDSSSDDEGPLGGSCTGAEQCYEVSSPADYDVKSECGYSDSTWSADHCDLSKYARKCTQEVQISENNGPEKTVIYVYYFAESSKTGCAGEEVPL